MKAEFKRKLIAALVVPAMGLSVAGAAIAASEKTDTNAMMKQPAAAQDLRASKLIGMKVKNAQGETLGKIDDLVVDVNNDRVYYAVLASGGVAGMGSKLFAYPISLFHEEPDRKELALNVDKEKLKNAPGFERKNWPDWGQKEGYRSEVDRYYGPTVTAKAMPNERLMRASDLIGKDVKDREGKKSGEIKDLAVNIDTGKVHYAVLDIDKNWMTSGSDRMVPLSLHAFNYPTERNKDLVLNVAKNQIDTSQGIEKKRWNDMDINAPSYQRMVDNSLSSSSSRGAAGPTGSRSKSETSDKD